MKTRYEILLMATVMGMTEIIYYDVQADQQTVVDQAIDFAKTLTGDVETLSTTTDVTTVPGYGGDTTLPETNYYNNQDLNSLQTDAMVGINTGTANDASQFAYQQSLQPKLQFGVNDPIMTNSDTISTDAMTNPDVLTVQTGSCDVVDVSTGQTLLETCTSWLQPTTQTCNKTLNVDVTWESISSCPIASGFNEVQAAMGQVINGPYWEDYYGNPEEAANDNIFARAYCNPDSGSNSVEIQVKASDNNTSDCSGWSKFTVSTNQQSETYTGVISKPNWSGSGSCSDVPAFVKGSCSGTTCNYEIKFYELSDWNSGSGASSCDYSVKDLISLGYISSGSYGGNHCVRRSASVNLSFEKPNITETSTVTDTWNDGCGLLEAQVQ